MEVASRRFGPVEVDAQEVLEFPGGLIGMERCRRWILLADAGNDTLGWLQSVDRPELALGVVSPQCFVPEYRLRVARRDLDPLQLERVEDAMVMVVVSQHGDEITLNLKAPLLLNTDCRLAAQVIAKDDHPLQHALSPPTAPLKKSA